MPQDIQIRPDAVRTLVNELETLVDNLHSRTEQYRKSISAAQAGDHQHLLANGLDTAYDAARGGYEAEFMLRELIRNALATVTLIEIADRPIETSVDYVLATDILVGSTTREIYQPAPQIPPLSITSLVSTDSSGPPLETNVPPSSDVLPNPTVPNGVSVTEPVPTDIIALWYMVKRRYKQDDQTPEEQAGPIGITQIGPNRFLVTLSGIENHSFWQANRLSNSILDETIGISSYLAVVRETIREQIPPDSELVFAAHSHGGIVAQNLVADPFFNDNRPYLPFEQLKDDKIGQYKITHVITYGSPISQPPIPGVAYRMFATNLDTVPLAAQVKPYARNAMEAQPGNYTRIPTVYEPNDSGFFAAHSAYGSSLKALQHDPQFTAEHPGFFELPFEIDMWSQTETFHAYRWDAYN